MAFPGGVFLSGSVLAAALVLPAAATTGQANDPVSLPAAEQALRAKKYADALAIVESILRKRPADPTALLLRGRVFLAQNQPAAALRDFEKIVELSPKSATAHFHAALAQRQMMNLKAAKAAAQQAAALSPEVPDAALLLAEVQLLDNEPQAAIEELRRLVVKHPQERRAYWRLGNAYLQTKEPALAAEAFRRLKDLAPQDHQVPLLLAAALSTIGRRAEARQELEGALASSPDPVPALSMLVSMDVVDNQKDAALARVKKQLESRPRSAALYQLLGSVHEARGETDAAETAYLTSLEIDPDPAGAYVRLGRLYAASGKHQQALTRAEAVLKKNPRNAGALMISAVVREQTGDLRGAEAAYERVLEVQPRFAPAANNLAWLYSERGANPDRALKLARLARERVPQDPHVADTLGWILYKEGKYGEALALLTESATKLAESALVQYHLGMAHYRLGNKELARQALDKALSLDAGFSGADEARRTLASLK